MSPTGVRSSVVSGPRVGSGVTDWSLMPLPRPAPMPDRTRTLLILPSFVVLALVAAAWFSGLLRADFWADDFTNLSLYNHSVGDLTNTARNDGKYTINVFWWLGTVAFGTGSALPFIMVVSAVTVIGVVLWLRAGVPESWGQVQAWWVAAALAATSTPLGILLWASNIVHAVSFLSLGIAFAAHRRAQASATVRGGVAWSAAGAAAWLLLIVSNPLYLGALLLAVVFGVREYRGWITRAWPAPRTRKVAALITLLAQAGIPSMYFVLVAYPRTTSRSSYSTFGFGEIRGNVQFYMDRLAPTWWGLAVAVSIVLAAGVLTIVRARVDVFPLTLMISAAAIAGPVFMQGQQRADHYLAVPVLLVLSALAAAVGARGTRGAWAQSPVVRVAGVSAALLSLFVLFDSSSGVRAWWTTTPLGSQLSEARDRVAEETSAGDPLCVELEMSDAASSAFLAGIGGEAGLQLPPVLAGTATYVGPGECSGSAHTVQVFDDLGMYRAVVLGEGG